MTLFMILKMNVYNEEKGALDASYDLVIMIIGKKKLEREV